jgi:hypothetical protein
VLVLLYLLLMLPQLLLQILQTYLLYPLTLLVLLVLYLLLLPPSLLPVLQTFLICFLTRLLLLLPWQPELLENINLPKPVILPHFRFPVNRLLLLLCTSLLLLVA